MIYAYDFGDSWEHVPEDCVGIPGFYNLLDALADPSNERHEELSDWMGDDSDPQAFSFNSGNRKLAPKRRGSTAAMN